MPRTQPVRLREAAPHQPLRDAEIIDAEFRVVGRKRALSTLWKALFAVFWAAVIGFLIPPAWIFFESIGASFAGR